MLKTRRRSVRIGLLVGTVVLMLVVDCSHLRAQSKVENRTKGEKKILGLDTVIAFYGAPKELRSPTFVLSSEWKYWKDRGGVAAVSKTWYELLQNPLEKGSDIIINLNYGDNPNPVVCIDEFGFDYDGQIDQKTAALLMLTKKKKPDLNIAVWQMRGPVAPKLAETYRKVVDLVLMETYVSPKDNWMIALQLQAARLNGLLEKSIIGLGLGSESEDLGGYDWTRTKDELEEQIRFIKLVAPESPGVAFFGLWPKEHPITRDEVDEVCSRFRKIPTDGTGLRPEMLELAETFTKRYEKPTLVCSPSLVEPNYTTGQLGADNKWTGWGRIQRPPTFRALMMNLGEQDAKDVMVHLRNRGEDGNIWATGIVDIPARSITIAVLTVHGKWEGWVGEWNMEVEAAGCEVLNYNYSFFKQ